MRFFQELGSTLERRWRGENYHDRAFPGIAARALAEVDLVGEIDPWDIVRSLHDGTELPSQKQQEDRFGDLAITLYQGERFYVDAYFWLDGTTSIHQHGFSGAFQVLLGSSIQSLYGFEPEREVSDHFSVGRILLNDVQLLRRGDIRPIHPGDQFIHALFHLDRPSVTITVRTKRDIRALPQYEYLKPYFAVDPFIKDASIFRKTQSAMLLLRMQHPGAAAIIGELVSSSDFHTTFSVLQATFDCLAEAARERAQRPAGGPAAAEPPDERVLLEALFDVARGRHGALVDFIPAVISERQRQFNLLDLRKHVTDADDRFFLALILNVPHRRQVLELLKQRWPDRDSAEVICERVAHLSATRAVRARERYLLGLEGFGEDHLLILRHLLRAASDADIKNALDGEHPAGGAGRLGDRLEDVRASFRESLLIRPLLFDSAEQPAAAAS